MNPRVEQAKPFASLHRKGGPFIQFNIREAGRANPLATGRRSVAVAQGYVDGENMPLDLVPINLPRIVAAVPLHGAGPWRSATQTLAKATRTAHQGG
ncbi:beta/alpha barrel domain-containing protein [Sphingosinicella rhizophila]|uniref:Uncharacterized protein n=1 Tax=Sphingosinicella rhizophila TaxID=3050082 RepID=A0ABU3Q734_9SPHN|nr:hypothetical protein [Sphingosinicella sp. GR2756]MDT9599211.1 hypothetical protein [Sphingosinicella sp. GR2756]